MVLLMLSNSFIALAQSNTGQQVLLCTSQGYKLVSIDEPASNTDQGKTTTHCVFCLLKADGELPVVLTAKTLNQAFLEKERYQFINTELISDSSPFHRPFSRAPPYIS